MDLDYIIVGQGLAGSSLALELGSRHQRIKVIDNPQGNQCSSVAAGLFNPLTTRTLSLTWLAESIFPMIISFYRKWENVLNTKFLFTQPIYVPFISSAEQVSWPHRIPSSIWIKEAYYSPHFDQVHNPLGGLLLNPDYCGWLNVSHYIQAVRQWLISRDAYEQHLFCFNRLQLKKDQVVYDNWKAKKIIFCTGIHHNPFTKGLPLHPLHGETLTITTDVPLSTVFNRGVYITPHSLQTTQYNVGATYVRKEIMGITTQGQRELIDKLKNLLRIPYQKIHANWGIRPSTKTRRPVLESHPQQKNIVIFTGLGTRGVSLAPYFSTYLTDWLLTGKPPQNKITTRYFIG